MTGIILTFSVATVFWQLAQLISCSLAKPLPICDLIKIKMWSTYRHATSSLWVYEFTSFYDLYNLLSTHYMHLFENLRVVQTLTKKTANFLWCCSTLSVMNLWCHARLQEHTHTHTHMWSQSFDHRYVRVWEASFLFWATHSHSSWCRVSHKWFQFFITCSSQDWSFHIKKEALLSL